MVVGLIVPGLCGLPLLLAQEGETPVFPARADSVLLDLVVHDGKGHPVPDLRADEIEVFENGQPCPITSFRLVQAESESPSPPPPAGPAPRPGQETPAGNFGGTGASGGVVPTTAAPSRSVEDDSRRRPGQPGTPGRQRETVVLLVFDRLGKDAARRAREAALDMVEKPFPADTWFAVFKIGQGFSMLQPFTSEPRRLTDPIERATTGSERAEAPANTPDHGGALEEAIALESVARQAEAAGTGGADAAMARALANLAAMAAGMETARRSEGSLYPLLALARALRTVSGRKTLLYFSEGLSVDAHRHLEVLESVISDANRSNLTIYGFDARGLNVESPWESTKRALSLAAGGGEAPGGKGLDWGSVALTANPRLNLQHLAEDTGGLLVADANDLRPALYRVAEDLRAYYEVGYASPNPEPDGKWRRIEVKVTRPGVVVRTRKGYFALPPGAPIVRPSELPLVAALDQKVLPRDVPVRAAALHLAGAGAERDVVVIVKVPLASATLVDAEPAGDEARWQARLAVLAFVRGDQGRLVARLSHDAPLEGAEGERRTLGTRSLVVRRTLRLGPGRYTLEAAVLDHASGRTGASRGAFDVPGGDGLELGSAVLVQPQPLPEGSDDALSAGDVRGAPRLGEPFVASESTVAGVFLTLRPRPTAEQAELTLETRRGGETVARSEPVLPPPDAQGRIAYLGMIPTARWPPGRYVLTARARQGDETATVATSFEIVAGEDRPLPSADERRVAETDESRESLSPPPVPADVVPLLEAAGRYVEDFKEKFANIVAEETYRQWLGSRVQTLRSDMVFVTLPRDVPWVTFRDVYEVDGQAVRDREARLEGLFMKPGASTLERANAILRESARYNLGPTYRTINTPTLALVMLLRQQQPRFAWERKGTRQLSGRTGVELQAREMSRPTLVRQLDGDDVPVDARFWVEAETGRVLRTEVHYEVPRDEGQELDAECWVDTQYSPDQALSLWVPDNMYEKCGHLESRARYSHYRRFLVETSEEGARVEGAPQPP